MRVLLVYVCSFPSTMMRKGPPREEVLFRALRRGDEGQLRALFDALFPVKCGGSSSPPCLSCLPLVMSARLCCRLPLLVAASLCPLHATRFVSLECLPLLCLALRLLHLLCLALCLLPLSCFWLPECMCPLHALHLLGDGWVVLPPL